MIAHAALEPMLEPAAMRLSMGELTLGEVFVAQTAARLAVARLGLMGWAVVAQAPDPDLLMSIAVRLDHGLGVPDFYNQIHALAQAQGDGQVLDAPGHAQRLERTLELAEQAHAVVVGAGCSVGAVPDAVVQTLQAQVVADLAHPEALEKLFQERAEDAPGPEDAAGVARAAVRYALTHLQRHGLAVLAEQPTDSVVARVAGVLQAHAQARGLPSGVSVERLQRSWDADARRIHEEIVGLGFYTPGRRPPGSMPARPTP